MLPAHQDRQLVSQDASVPQMENVNEPNYQAENSNLENEVSGIPATVSANHEIGSNRERRYPLRERKTEHFSFSCLSSNEPENVSEALNSSESKYWLDAMKDEYHSLLENETWTLVDRPVDSNVVKSKWVFKRKQNEGGSIRYKARLVAKGYSQIHGVL